MDSDVELINDSSDSINEGSIGLQNFLKKVEHLMINCNQSDKNQLEKLHHHLKHRDSLSSDLKQRCESVLNKIKQKSSNLSNVIIDLTDGVIENSSAKIHNIPDSTVCNTPRIHRKQQSSSKPEKKFSSSANGTNNNSNMDCNKNLSVDFPKNSTIPSNKRESQSVKVTYNIANNPKCHKSDEEKKVTAESSSNNNKHGILNSLAGTVNNSPKDGNILKKPNVIMEVDMFQDKHKSSNKFEISDNKKDVLQCANKVGHMRINPRDPRPHPNLEIGNSEKPSTVPRDPRLKKLEEQSRSPQVEKQNHISPIDNQNFKQNLIQQAGQFLNKSVPPPILLKPEFGQNNFQFQANHHSGQFLRPQMQPLRRGSTPIPFNQPQAQFYPQMRAQIPNVIRMPSPILCSPRNVSHSPGGYLISPSSANGYRPRYPSPSGFQKSPRNPSTPSHYSGSSPYVSFHNDNQQSKKRVYASFIDEESNETDSITSSSDQTDSRKEIADDGNNSSSSDSESINSDVNQKIVAPENPVRTKSSEKWGTKAPTPLAKQKGNPTVSLFNKSSNETKQSQIKPLMDLEIPKHILAQQQRTSKSKPSKSNLEGSQKLSSFSEDVRENQEVRNKGNEIYRHYIPNRSGFNRSIYEHGAQQPILTEEQRRKDKLSMWHKKTNDWRNGRGRNKSSYNNNYHQQNLERRSGGEIYNEKRVDFGRPIQRELDINVNNQEKLYDNNASEIEFVDESDVNQTEQTEINHNRVEFESNKSEVSTFYKDSFESSEVVVDNKTESKSQFDFENKDSITINEEQYTAIGDRKVIKNNFIEIEPENVGGIKNENLDNTVSSTTCIKYDTLREDDTESAMITESNTTADDTESAITESNTTTSYGFDSKEIEENEILAQISEEIAGSSKSEPKKKLTLEYLMSYKEKIINKLFLEMLDNQSDDSSKKRKKKKKKKKKKRSKKHSGSLDNSDNSSGDDSILENKSKETNHDNEFDKNLIKIENSDKDDKLDKNMVEIDNPDKDDKLDKNVVENEITDKDGNKPVKSNNDDVKSENVLEVDSENGDENLNEENKGNTGKRNKKSNSLAKNKKPNFTKSPKIITNSECYKPPREVMCLYDDIGKMNETPKNSIESIGAIRSCRLRNPVYTPPPQRRVNKNKKQSITIPEQESIKDEKLNTKDNNSKPKLKSKKTATTNSINENDQTDQLSIISDKSDSTNKSSRKKNPVKSNNKTKTPMKGSEIPNSPQKVENKKPVKGNIKIGISSNLKTTIKGKYTNKNSLSRQKEIATLRQKNKILLEEQAKKTQISERSENCLEENPEESDDTAEYQKQMEDFLASVESEEAKIFVTEIFEKSSCAQILLKNCTSKVKPCPKRIKEMKLTKIYNSSDIINADNNLENKSDLENKSWHVNKIDTLSDNRESHENKTLVSNNTKSQTARKKTRGRPSKKFKKDSDVSEKPEILNDEFSSLLKDFNLAEINLDDINFDDVPTLSNTIEEENSLNNFNNYDDPPILDRMLPEYDEDENDAPTDYISENNSVKELTEFFKDLNDRNNSQQNLFISNKSFDGNSNHDFSANSINEIPDSTSVPNLEIINHSNSGGIIEKNSNTNSLEREVETDFSSTGVSATSEDLSDVAVPETLPPYILDLILNFPDHNSFKGNFRSCTVGFIKVYLEDSKLIYKCLVPDCNFQTLDNQLFGRHVSTNHKERKWNGFCEICNKKSGNNESILFTSLFHIISFHLDSVMQNADTDNSATSVTEESGSVVEKAGSTSTDVVDVRSSSKGKCSNSAELEQNATINESDIKMKKESIIAVQIDDCNPFENHQKASSIKFENNAPSDSEPNSNSADNLEQTEPSSTEPQNGQSSENISTPPDGLRLRVRRLSGDLLSGTIPNTSSEILCSNLEESEMDSSNNLEETGPLSSPSKTTTVNPIIGTPVKLNITNLNGKKCLKSIEALNKKQSNRIDWPCSHCSEVFFFLDDLYDHMAQEHGYCRFKCSYCTYKACEACYVVWHQKLFHQGRVFHILSSSKENRREFLQNLSATEILDFVLPYTDKICNLQFLTSTEFMAHIKAEHKFVKTLQCDICRERIFKAYFISHMKGHHINELQCPYCLFGAPTDEVMKVHLFEKHFMYPAKTIIRDPSKQKIDQNNILRNESINDPRWNRLLYFKGLREQVDKSYIHVLKNAITKGIDSNLENESDHITTPPHIEENSTIDNGTELGPRDTLTPVIVDAQSIAESDTIISTVENEIELSTPNTSAPIFADVESVVESDMILSAVENEPELSPRDTSSPINANVQSVAESDEISSTIDNGTELSPRDTSTPVIVDVQSVPQSEISSTVDNKTESSISNISAPIIVDVQSVVESDTILWGNSETANTNTSTNFECASESNEIVDSEIGDSIDCTSISDDDGLNLDIEEPCGEHEGEDSDNRQSYEFNCLSTNGIEMENVDCNRLTGVSLYKCGFTECDFAAESEDLLKDHLHICERQSQCKQLKCSHCAKSFQRPLKLVEHLQIHGIARYICTMCDFRSCLQKRLVVHMTKFHKVTNVKIIPVDPLKSDKDRDLFLIFPQANYDGSVIYSTTGKLSRNRSSVGLDQKLIVDKVVNSCSEIERNFLKPLFNEPVGCGLCMTYTTKVRSNLLTHLKLHETRIMLNRRDIINPAPCVGKKEKMFDKMTNHAAYRSKSSTSAEAENADPSEIRTVVVQGSDYKKLPPYVPENVRYSCTGPDCHYKAASAGMLKYHYETLHADLANFRCPHCDPSIQGSQKISLDRIRTHFRMHDRTLFKCVYCVYYHNQKSIVERHSAEKHPNVPAKIEVIRELEDSEETNISREARLSYGHHETPLTEKVNQEAAYMLKRWRCNICQFGTCTTSQMEKHLISGHNMYARYKCAFCAYHADTEDLFDDHFKACHALVNKHTVTTYYEIVEEFENSAKDDKGKEFNKNSPNPRPLISKNILNLLPINDDQMKESLKNFHDTYVDMTEKKRIESFGTPEKGMFCCPICKLLYKYAYQLVTHLYQHYNYMRWACTDCGLLNMQKDSLVKHAENVHKKRKCVFPLTPDIVFERWVNDLLQHQSFELSKEQQSTSTPHRLRNTSANQPLPYLHDAISRATASGFLNYSNSSSTASSSSSNSSRAVKRPRLFSPAVPNSSKPLTVILTDSSDDEEQEERLSPSPAKIPNILKRKPLNDQKFALSNPGFAKGTMSLDSNTSILSKQNISLRTASTSHNNATLDVESKKNIPSASTSSSNFASSPVKSSSTTPVGAEIFRRTRGPRKQYDYTDEDMKNAILDSIRGGLSQKKICENYRIPLPTFQTRRRKYISDNHLSAVIPTNSPNSKNSGSVTPQKTNYLGLKPDFIIPSATKLTSSPQLIRDSDETLKYTCILCEVSYNTVAEMDLHVAFTHLGKGYHCLYCDSVFTLMESLKHHHEKQHKGTPMTVKHPKLPKNLNEYYVVTKNNQETNLDETMEQNTSPENITSLQESKNNSDILDTSVFDFDETLVEEVIVSPSEEEFGETSVVEEVILCPQKKSALRIFQCKWCDKTFDSAFILGDHSTICFSKKQSENQFFRLY